MNESPASGVEETEREGRVPPLAAVSAEAPRARRGREGTLLAGRAAAREHSVRQSRPAEVGRRALPDKQKPGGFVITRPVLQEELKGDPRPK